MRFKGLMSFLVKYKYLNNKLHFDIELAIFGRVTDLYESTYFVLLGTDARTVLHIFTIY